MKSLFIALFLAFFCCNESQAVGLGKTFYLGTGALFYDMGKVTSSDDASTSLVGQIYIPLALTAKLPLGLMNLEPKVTYTPLGVKASDSVTKKILTLGVDAVFNASILDIKGGLGLLMYTISGSGGTTTLNNGTGTATFYLPGTSQTSKSLFIDVGTGMELGGNFRLDLDLIAVSLLSTRRAFSGVLLFSKGFF